MSERRYAYFLVEPGGATDEVIQSWSAKASAWMEAAKKIACDAFGAGTDVYWRSDYSQMFAVPKVARRRAPRGWVQADREGLPGIGYRPKLNTRAGQAINDELRALAPPSSHQSTIELFGRMIEGPDREGEPQIMRFHPGWKQVGDAWILFIREPKRVAPLQTPAGTRRLKTSEYWQMVEAEEAKGAA